MIKCVTYPGGLHGEFIISQIIRHNSTRFWCNVASQPYRWGQANRYKVYYNNGKNIKPLTAHWNDDEVEKYWDIHDDGRDFIVRKHDTNPTKFPELTFFPDTYFWYERSVKLLQYKHLKTEHEKYHDEIIPESEWEPRKGKGQINIPISAFFDFTALELVEQFFKIKYTDEMKQEIIEYKKRDDEIFWSMSS